MENTERKSVEQVFWHMSDGIGLFKQVGNIILQTHSCGQHDKRCQITGGGFNRPKHSPGNSWPSSPSGIQLFEIHFKNQKTDMTSFLVNGKANAKGCLMASRGRLPCLCFKAYYKKRLLLSWAVHLSVLPIGEEHCRALRAVEICKHKKNNLWEHSGCNYIQMAMVKMADLMYRHPFNLNPVAER